jgi:hypothetical protein
MMNRIVLCIVFTSFCGLANAQFLRAGGFAIAVNADGNPNQTSQQAWMSATALTTLTKTASASNDRGNARASFTSAFGVLRGQTSAHTNGTGPANSSASGTFFSFNNQVGAGFFDTFTMAGVGPVVLRINYSFHAINVDPNSSTVAESKLKLDTFSSTTTARVNLGQLVIDTAGEQTLTGSFEVSGVAGTKFDFLAELSSFSAVSLENGVIGSLTASSDASSTALLTVTAISGSYSTSSGATYAEPVPEPASLLALGLGAIALRRRSKK